MDDEAHWGVTKNGKHGVVSERAWKNKEDDSWPANLFQIMVTATPYNALTAASRVPCVMASPFDGQREVVNGKGGKFVVEAGQILSVGRLEYGKDKKFSLELSKIYGNAAESNPAMQGRGSTIVSANNSSASISSCSASVSGGSNCGSNSNTPNMTEVVELTEDVFRACGGFVERNVVQWPAEDEAGTLHDHFTTEKDLKDMTAALQPYLDPELDRLAESSKKYHSLSFFVTDDRVKADEYDLLDSGDSTFARHPSYALLVDYVLAALFFSLVYGDCSRSKPRPLELDRINYVSDFEELYYGMLTKSPSSLDANGEPEERMDEGPTRLKIVLDVMAEYSGEKRIILKKRKRVKMK